MLSIVIPAHNEADRISPTLEAYARFFDGKTRAGEIDGVEILISINASTDRTLEIVQAFAARYPQVTYIDLVEGGKGYAILEGLRRCRGDVVGFVDADMSTSPEAFYHLYQHLGGCDGIIGSRWLKGSKTERSFGKYVRSRAFNALVRALFLLPFADTQCGAKILRTAKIAPFLGDIGSLNWVFDVNLLYLCGTHGLTIREHPTEWTDKEGSKVGLRVPLLMAAGVIRLRLEHSPFRFVVDLYNRMPEWMKVHHQ
jgi:glycosyltransferase involved in cell wall biosynthesis